MMGAIMHRRCQSEKRVRLDAIAGHDPRDPVSADVPVPAFTEGLEGGARGLRVGVLEARVAEADAEVTSAVRCVALHLPAPTCVL
jgi:hypothetical protein